MKKIVIFFVMVTMVFSLCGTLYTQTAKAFNDKLPDLADTAGGAAIANMSQQSRYVRSTNADIGIWLTSSSGSLTVYGINYCSSNPNDYLQSGDWFASHSLANGSNITKFTISGAGLTTQVRYGKKYGSGDARCNDSYTFNLSNITQKQNGYYYVQLDVDFVDNKAGQWDGFSNAYSLNVNPNTGFIGARGGSTGHTITQEQTDTSPAYTTYYAKFGTPCNVSSNTTATLTFYDLDNAGGAGAQPTSGPPVKVVLRDDTANSYVNFAGSVGTVWTVPDTPNAPIGINFTAIPQHKYTLELRDVYYNNTIQYSVPYAQIFAKTCKEATIDPAAKVTLFGSSASVSSVPLGSKVTFTNSVTTSATKNTGSDSFDYAITSTGPQAISGTDSNGTPATQGTSTDPNKQLDPDRLAVNSIFDFTPLAVGKYCRTIAVSGLPNNPPYVSVSGGATAQACVTVTPCTGVCGGGGGLPSPNITATNYERLSGTNPLTPTLNCPAGYTGTVTWRVTGNGMPGTDQVTTCPGGASATSIPYSQPGNPSSTLDGVALGAITTYTAHIVTPSGIADDTADVSVYEVPYARFIGQDIYACGGGSAPSNGRIIFNVGPTDQGAAVKYAAIAVNGFNDSGNTGGPAIDKSPNIATAFSLAGGADSLRTQYASSVCSSPTPPDPSGTGTLAPTSFDLGAATNPAGFYTNTASNVSVSGNVGSKKITIHVTGSILITGNINSTIPTGAYDGTNAPYVLLIADGDIYISNTVTNINAVLVANNGTIHTCSTGTTDIATSTPSNRHKTPANGGCAAKLTINGALSADHITFGRSIGTRYDATSTDGAEQIIFPAYLNFANPYEPVGSTSPGYDSIFNAPPYL